MIRPHFRRFCIYRSLSLMKSLGAPDGDPNLKVQIENASWPVSRVLYGRPCGRNVAAIHLGRTLPAASCNQPGRLAGNSLAACPSRHPYSVLLPVGFAMPPLLPVRAVGSYPTLSPLPRHISAVYPQKSRPISRRGGFLSVALSLGSPPPDVIRHRVSMEPGLSSHAAFRHMTCAAARPLATAYKCSSKGICK